MTNKQLTWAEMQEEVVCTNEHLKRIGRLRDERASTLKMLRQQLPTIEKLWYGDDALKAREACAGNEKTSEGLANLITKARECFHEEPPAFWEITGSSQPDADLMRRYLTRTWNMLGFMIFCKDPVLGGGDYTPYRDNITAVRFLLQSKGYKTTGVAFESEDEIEVIASEIDILSKWWETPNAQQAYQNLEESDLPKHVLHNLTQNTQYLYFVTGRPRANNYSWENPGATVGSAEEVRMAVTKTWLDKVNLHFPLPHRRKFFLDD